VVGVAEVITWDAFCDDAGHFSVDRAGEFREAVEGDPSFRGKELSISVQLRKYRRSQQANAYYWSCVVAAAAKESGQGEDSIHTFWCEQFLPSEKKRLKFFSRLTGQALQVDVDPRRTSKLMGSPFYDYVENCRLWCQEWLGVTTPDPDPDYWRKRKAVK
jgi:hypothetical protein